LIDFLKKMKNIYIFLLIIFSSNFSFGASFDCGVARTTVEKLICSDKELSIMDDNLTKNYATALASVNEPSKKQLIDEERSWLKYTRSLCDDISCLRRAYEAREKLIKACLEYCPFDNVEYAVNGEKYNLSTLRDANERNRSFNDDLRSKRLGEILGCEALIDVPVGTAHGNHSYGGLCKVKSPAETGYMMVCNDDMLGHFKTEKSSSGIPKVDLVNFTIKNCFGG
jgi:uncharacterized protein